MKVWKGRYIILVLCLVSCLALEGGQNSLRLCAATQAQSDQAEQDSTEGEGIQGISDAGGMTGFVIDNQNQYEGMEKSYSSGYIPKVEGNKAMVVLPLLAKRKLSQNRVTVSLRLGDSENPPFVQKNYDKTVSFAYHKTVNQGKLSGCYLITFHLALKKDRYNGNYPVVLSVAAEDESGNEINQDFTVYVTIRDGKDVDGLGSQGTSDTGGASYFAIDNQTVYPGMDKSYAQGYVPKVVSGNVMVVLPLQAKYPLSEKRVTASMSFGESENLPFVRQNYNKVVPFAYHRTEKDDKKKGCYLLRFCLKRKKEYYNGSYPVTISVQAKSKSGSEISQDFTIYVTLTGGKEMNGDGTDSGASVDNQPQFAPKVRVDSCQFSESPILCGQEFTAKLTLLNTSKTDMAKNMLVTIVPGENMELPENTGSSYVESLGSGKSCTLSVRLRVKAEAPSGQYDISVNMDYADPKGNACTREEMIKISAQQTVQMEIAPIRMPKEIQLGDTVEVQTQAMNLGKGKLYNVRASLEADGLAASGLAFIGDMEAGSSMSGSLELSAEGLSGDSLYGTTQGKVTFYYEDELGNEMTQEQSFETTILSPLKSSKEDAPTDDTRQWWIIMAVIVFCLAQAAVMFLYRRRILKVKPN